MARVRYILLSPNQSPSCHIFAIRAQVNQSVMLALSKSKIWNVFCPAIFLRQVVSHQRVKQSSCHHWIIIRLLSGNHQAVTKKQLSIQNSKVKKSQSRGELFVRQASNFEMYNLSIYFLNRALFLYIHLQVKGSFLNYVRTQGYLVGQQNAFTLVNKPVTLVTYLDKNMHFPFSVNSVGCVSQCSIIEVMLNYR